MYEGIMAAIPDLRIESVLRFGDAEHVVDEAVASGHVEGSFLGVEGGGAPVSFRILHVFDLRDGLIAREQAWFDTGGVLRQIEGAEACFWGELREQARGAGLPSLAA